MKKRGQSNIGIIVVVLITVLIIVFIFKPRITNAAKPFFLLFGIGEEDTIETELTILSPTELAFESFLMSYEDCKNYKSRGCLCDEFDVTKIPDGYSIKLENLGREKTRIELYENNKPTAEKVKVIDNDDLFFYEYDKSLKNFLTKRANEIVLDPKSNNLPYKINNKIQLFRYDEKHVCFVSGTYESKVFEEITKSRLKCNLKDAGVKTARLAMIDFNDYTGDYPSSSFVQSKDSEASKIIENLRTFLLSNVGSITRITESIATKQLRLERRQNMFNDAYENFDRNKDGFISGDVYFISIRALQLGKEKSQIKKDYFKVHYLQGSEQSKILAGKIRSKLGELNGKLIFNNKEVSKAEADEKNRFEFEIVLEENSRDNIGPVFLTCTQSYSNFIACKESTLIPAIFVDVVEVYDDEHYMFEGHHRVIAEKISEGVKGYLSEKESI